MISVWVWWLAAALAFLGTLLMTAGAAYGKEWPSRLLDFLGLIVLAWGVFVALICGVVELIAWWTS